MRDFMGRSQSLTGFDFSCFFRISFLFESYIYLHKNMINLKNTGEGEISNLIFEVRHTNDFKKMLSCLKIVKVPSFLLCVSEKIYFKIKFE